MLRRIFDRVRNKTHIKISHLRSCSTTFHETSAHAHTREWLSAKPFESLPGPSKYELLRGYMPGGKFHQKSFVDFSRQLRSQYGDIYIVPGLFGKRDVVFSYNPSDYQKVFRSEGLYPMRRGFDVIQYYRTHLKKDVFKHAIGLVAAQGKSWAEFRSAVNPIMMNPNTVKIYIPKMDQVASKFVKCIRRIRDPNTLEVPDNFEKYIKYWTMDTVGLVALDTDLNMIENSEGNPKAKTIIESSEEFFELLLELDFQPSMWKVIPTPKFKKIVKLLDTMTELALEYVQQAMHRLENSDETKAESDQSILERLVRKDPLVATTMALDIFLAGTDATTSALTGCLLNLAKNPQKQSRLREELLSPLPQMHDALTKDNTKHLPYLRACIKESLRVYPIIAANFRTTGRNVVLSGYCVPEMTDVSMSTQLLFKDPKYFVQPEEFLPERWLRSTTTASNQHIDSITKKEPFIYLPFGFGPRICVGKRIVDLELETVLSRLLRNFEIRFDYPTDNVFKSNIVNLPSKPLKFKFIDLTY